MNWQIFIDYVTKMRQAQRDYFLTRKWQPLNEAKKYERLVDDMISTFEAQQEKDKPIQTEFNFD